MRKPAPVWSLTYRAIRSARSCPAEGGFEIGDEKGQTKAANNLAFSYQLLGRHEEAIELLEENFGERVFASRIRKTIRFAEAPVKGMSVLKYDPDGMAAHSYRQLAKEVLSNAKR